MQSPKLYIEYDKGVITLLATWLLDNEKLLFNMFRYSTCLMVIVTSTFLATWHRNVSAKHMAILTGYATCFSNLVKQLVT